MKLLKKRPNIVTIFSIFPSYFYYYFPYGMIQHTDYSYMICLFILDDCCPPTITCALVHIMQS